MPQKGVLFLDRDGVINIDSGFVVRIEEIVLMHDIKLSLEILKPFFQKICVVTNQSAVGRGMVTIEKINEINLHLNNLLEGIIDQFFVCPHLPDDNCKCRKPLTGHLDGVLWWSPALAQNSVMVGDRDSDLQFGKNLKIPNRFLMMHEKQASSEFGESVANWKVLTEKILEVVRE